MVTPAETFSQQEKNPDGVLGMDTVGVILATLEYDVFLQVSARVQLCRKREGARKRGGGLDRAQLGEEHGNACMCVLARVSFAGFGGGICSRLQGEVSGAWWRLLGFFFARRSRIEALTKIHPFASWCTSCMQMIADAKTRFA